MLSVKSESVKSFHESFYGTPTQDESRRRRGKKRQPKQREEPQNEVSVIGVHYRSFDDDSMAAFVNSATALVAWNGDAKLLIDRYDVRHLLQDLSGVRRRRARPPSPDATKEELDYERYRDVEGLENPSPPEDDDIKNENAPDGGYQRVGFNYSTTDDQSTRKERVEETIFSPPFFVPEHLCAKLPTSTKVHQIMAGTAKYVIEHGGQAEIVLRVKQANNPTFGFLMPDHYLHEYFRFLVDHPEHVGIGTQQVAPADSTIEVSSIEAEGGLSLLGTAYGDADEDEEDEVSEEQAQELAVAEVGPSDELSKDDGNSDSSSYSKRSSPVNKTTSEGAENATIDTVDSHDLALESVLPKTSGQEVAVEEGRNSVQSSGLQEPAPPGTEASGSEVAEGHEAHTLSEDLEHQVPPYKEPPIQLRRIIDKMVEFISRNGKEFEAIVRERDKNDRRFPFFLPWNEYYPYFSQTLEAARQASASGDTVVVSESVPQTGRQVMDIEQAQDSFLNGVPYWDESWTTESNGGNEEIGVSEVQDYGADKSHNGEGGMGFDAVLAAVRAATRGRPRVVEDSEAVDQLKVPERPEVGSDDAVIAAIIEVQDYGADKSHNGEGGMGFDAVVAAVRAATRGRPRAVEDSEALDQLKVPERPELGSDDAVIAAIIAAMGVTGRSKLDPAASIGKGEEVQMAGSSSPLVGIPLDPIKTVNGTGSDEGGKLTTSLPSSNAKVTSSLEEDRVMAAHVVAKAAAVAAAEEGDSLEAQLAPSEKRKAERLKRAKLFAAMIKDGQGSLANSRQGSGSVGISVTASLERFNQAGLALETTRLKSGDKILEAPVAEPDVRDQTGEALMQVEVEADKGEVLDSTTKDRKRKVKIKVKIKDQEEKQRKHHHKRKKDSEEKGNGSKHAPDAGEKRKDKHDYYQEKRKDRRHEKELEGKSKDRHGSEGMVIESRRAHDLESTRKDEEERKHDSRHGHEFEDRRDIEELRKNESRSGGHDYFDSDRKDNEETKRDRRHYTYDLEEKTKESRHEQDLEEKTREGHGHDAEEKRRDRKHGHEGDERRKETRYRHDAEEKRSNGRYGHELEETRTSRRHGKRRKHDEAEDVSDDKDHTSGEFRSKKSNRHHGELSGTGEYTEKQSKYHRELKDDKRHRDVAVLKQSLPGQTSPKDKVTAQQKPVATPIDVPDDIRAKVRAMLAMI